MAGLSGGRWDVPTRITQQAPFWAALPRPLQTLGSRAGQRVPSYLHPRLCLSLGTPGKPRSPSLRFLCCEMG